MAGTLSLKQKNKNKEKWHFINPCAMHERVGLNVQTDCLTQTGTSTHTRTHPEALTGSIAQRTKYTETHKLTI